MESVGTAFGRNRAPAEVRRGGFSPAAYRSQIFRRPCHAPQPSRGTAHRQRRLAAAWASVLRGCPEPYEAGLLPYDGSLNGWLRRAAAENPTRQNKNRSAKLQTSFVGYALQNCSSSCPMKRRASHRRLQELLQLNEGAHIEDPGRRILGQDLPQ